MMVYFDLFLSFFKVGSLSFGGAYSLLPIIEKEVVQNHAWLSDKEFLEVLGMVQIIPGAISIKYATYTGYKVGGIFGAVAANLGNLLVPAILIMFASYIYSKFSKYPLFDKAFRGIQFAVIGMIAAIVYQYASKMDLEWKSVFIMLVSMGLILGFKLHPAIVIGIAAILAMLLF